MITIIDYGMGNLHSVSHALKCLGEAYVISEDAEQVAQADVLLLPGVGAFEDAMRLLRQAGLDQAIYQAVNRGASLLGICLGMQLLFESSTETYSTNAHAVAGLGLIPGHIKRMPATDAHGYTVKIPHMGWNKLLWAKQEHPLFNQLEEGFAYFVHTFYATEFLAEHLLASANYHVNIPAIVGRERIYGMQFHPEKSGQTGARLLQNFLLQSKQVVEKE